MPSLGLSQANAATKAAADQEAAAKYASQIQLQMFDESKAGLAPFVQGGLSSLSALQKGLGIGTGGTGQGSLNTPYAAFNPSLASLEATPGYQFQLGQGEKAITSQATATGGVGGGNTLKALMDYGQGLAGTTYQNAFSNWATQAGLSQNQQNQSYNQLYNLLNLGESAAAGTGAQAISTGNSLASNAIGAGNAQAAGVIGASNASSSGINNLLSSLIGGGVAGGGGLFSILFSGGGGGASAALSILG